LSKDLRASDTDDSGTARSRHGHGQKETHRTRDIPGAHKRAPAGYEQFLGELKDRIRRAQLRASVAVNRGLIELYCQIGKGLVERQKAHGWGNSVIDRLGEDLQEAFPGMGGFSRTNVDRMRAFFLAYRDLFSHRLWDKARKGRRRRRPRFPGDTTWCSSNA
jgi:hypothetical protein